MRLSLLLLAFIVVNVGIAQQFYVTLSETIESKNSIKGIALSNGFINAGYLDYKWQDKFDLDKSRWGIRINKWNNKMDVVQYADLAGGEIQYGPYRHLIRTINNKHYLFYFQFVESGDIKFKVMMGEIDTVKLTIEKPVELFAVEDKSIGDFKKEDMRDYAGFFIISSPDQSKHAMVWTSGLTDDFYIATFDSDMSAILKKKHKTKKQGVNLRSVAIDNDATLWYGYTTIAGGHVGRLGKDGSVSEKQFRLNDQSVHSIHLAVTKNRKLNIGGTSASEGHWSGAYSLSMNIDDFTFKNIKHERIPIKIIEQISDDGFKLPRRSKGDLPWTHFVPYTLDDGTIILVTEFRKEERPPQGDRFMRYISGSLLHIKLGQEIVYARVPKHRVSIQNRIGDSYAAFPYKDQLIMFYNDSPANLKRDLNDKPADSDKYNEVMLVAAVVDNDGKVTRHRVIDLTKEDFLPIADQMFQTPAGKLVVPVQKIRKLGGIAPQFKWGYVTITD